ncbi:MAG TPA: hypothetical protein VLS93_15505 [Anaeromyxobacteraceae bacterium]|nr:hypothetical protein [Anaeromyxobacteraceae bacterium]
MLALLLLAAAAAPSADPGNRLELSASAGAAYDTNPARVSGISDDVGSAALVATASAGLARDVGDWWSFYGGIRLDGSHQVQFSDLSRAVAEAEAVVLFSPRDPVALVLSASAGRAFHGDSVRNGQVAGARAVLRLSPTDRLAFRVRGAYTRRWADDPLFSGEAVRGGLAAEVRVGSVSFLRAGFALERSDEVLYLPSGGMMASASASAGEPWTARFGPPGGFSQPVEPVRALAHARIASAGMELGMGRGTYLDAELSRSWVDADPASYVADTATVTVGVRR